MASTTTTTDVELGEESPLLDSGEKPLEDLTGTSKTERAVAGISAISFGSSLAAMLFESNPVVYISGLIGVVVSPYAAIQQQKITQVNALAQTNERMKEEVDQLKGENIKLNAQVADLGKSVDNLKITKDKLDTIQSVQGLSLDELERQLEESKQILGKMKQNLQGDVLSNLIEVAMACDEDGDFTLDDNEIDVIIHKLEKIHDVDVDNDKVRKMIVDSGRQLEGVLEVVKNLLRSDGPESENVFHIKHKA